MLPPSMSNKEKVVSGGSNGNMRPITLGKDNCDPWSIPMITKTSETITNLAANGMQQWHILLKHQ